MIIVLPDSGIQGVALIKCIFRHIAVLEGFQIIFHKAIL